MMPSQAIKTLAKLDRIMGHQMKTTEKAKPKIECV